MEKQVLKEKILKAVGLNAEYIDKVFDTFLKKVSKVLQVSQTIKFEEIGYFQLSIEPVSRLERDPSQKSKKILVFKSFDVNERLTYGSPFLTFEVEPENSQSSTFSESVFNLSIDTPSTIFDESETDDSQQSDDLLDASIQDYVNQLISGGIILDGYELLGKGSIEKIDADETLSSDIIKEVSRTEPIEPILEPEEPLDKETADASENEKTESKYQFDETLSKDDSDNLLRTKKEGVTEPADEKKNPFDELNDLINEAKEPQAEEKVESHAIYDEVKSSARSEERGNKRLLILAFAAVSVILLTAIIYFTSAPTDTSTKMQTYVDDSKETTKEEVVKPVTKVDSTVSDNSENIETSNEVTLLKEEAKEPVMKVPPKQVVKTNYSGLYRKIANDVSITNRIYFDSKKYTVQISSWKSKTIAEHEVKKLKKLGFDAFIYKVYIKSKDATYNRVRIGYFDSKNEAAQFLKRNKL